MNDGLRTKPPDLDAIRARADKVEREAAELSAPGDPLTPHVVFSPDEVRALLAEIERLREALTEVAGHPVISEKDDACDWHCTLTLVARAKDALAAQEPEAHRTKEPSECARETNRG